MPNLMVGTDGHLGNASAPAKGNGFMTEGRIALAAFCLSLCIIFFILGASVVYFRIFPYQAMRSSIISLEEIKQLQVAKDRGNFENFSTFDRHETASQRIKVVDDNSADANFLFFGGLYQFMDFCPERGCLAVVLSSSGDVVRAYPYRPGEIFAKNKASGFLYESINFDFARHAYPIGIEPYENGDLLVVFQGKHIFPYGAGVARVDREGNPIWFRWDFSHHWPTMAADEHALVPGIRVVDAVSSVPLPRGQIELLCKSGRQYHDTIRVLNPQGDIVREISVFESLVASPFRAVLQHTTDPCDPVHLNYVEEVSAELAGAVENLAVGDFIVSLRNISAFGFIGREDGRFKRLIRGTFLQQHSVQHLKDARFLIFDNHGGDLQGGPSRMLAVDLRTGVESTIFPTSETPEPYRSSYSKWAGHIEISKDRARAIVAFTEEGKAFEIRLTDGAILKVFNHLQDVSSLANFPEKRAELAAVFRLYGVGYFNER